MVFIVCNINYIKIFNYLCALDQARFSWICKWTWCQLWTAPPHLLMKNAAKLACLNWCCQLLSWFDGELYLVRWWRMFITSALSNMGTWNQASCDSKTQPFCKLDVLMHCLAWTCKSPTIPTDTQSDRFARFFVAATVELQKCVINKPHFSPFEQGSNW